MCWGHLKKFIYLATDNTGTTSVNNYANDFEVVDAPSSRFRGLPTLPSGEQKNNQSTRNVE